MNNLLNNLIFRLLNTYYSLYWFFGKENTLIFLTKRLNIFTFIYTPGMQGPFWCIISILYNKPYD